MHLLTTLLKPLIESLPEPSNLYTTHCHPMHHASLHHIPVHSAFIYTVLLMDEGLLTSPHSKFYPITVLKINLTYQKSAKNYPPACSQILYTVHSLHHASSVLCTLHAIHYAPFTTYTMHPLYHAPQKTIDCFLHPISNSIQSLYCKLGQLIIKAPKAHHHHVPKSYAPQTNE